MLMINRKPSLYLQWKRNVDIVAFLLECSEVTEINIDDFVYVHDPVFFEKILSSPKTHATSETLEKLVRSIGYVETYRKSYKFIIPDKETITSLFHKYPTTISMLTSIVSDRRIPLPDFTKELYETFKWDRKLLSKWGKRDSKVAEMVKDKTLKEAYSRTSAFLNMPFDEFKTKFYEKYPDGVVPSDVDLDV